MILKPKKRPCKKCNGNGTTEKYCFDGEVMWLCSGCGRLYKERKYTKLQLRYREKSIRELITYYAKARFKPEDIMFILDLGEEDFTNHLRILANLVNIPDELKNFLECFSIKNFQSNESTPEKEVKLEMKKEEGHE